MRLDTHQHFWRYDPAPFGEAAPALTRAADPGSVIKAQLPVEENA